jgi:hypothetical protein
VDRSCRRKRGGRAWLAFDCDRAQGRHLNHPRVSRVPMVAATG